MEKKAMTDTSVRVVAETWKSFKKLAIDRDLSQTDALEQALSEWLGNKPEPNTIQQIAGPGSQVVPDELIQFWLSPKEGLETNLRKTIADLLGIPLPSGRKRKP